MMIITVLQWITVEGVIDMSTVLLRDLRANVVVVDDDRVHENHSELNQYSSFPPYLTSLYERGLMVVVVPFTEWLE